MPCVDPSVLPHGRLKKIVLAWWSITPPASIHSFAFFGQSDNFWHSVQVECDFRKLTGDSNRLICDVQSAACLAAPSKRRHGARPALRSGTVTTGGNKGHS